MVKLDKQYRDKGLEILAFPCNQFGGQEPGTPEDIRKFVDKYDVKFQMFEKINVNGSETHPLYKFLKQKQKGLMGSLSIKWNFTKFIVDKDGNVLARLSPTTTLSSYEEKLKALLGIPPEKAAM